MKLLTIIRQYRYPILLLTLYFISYFGYEVFPLELPSHFAPYIFALTIFLFLITAMKKKLRAILICLALIGPIIILEIFFLGPPLAYRSMVKNELKIITYNVLMGNSKKAAVAKYIEDQTINGNPKNVLLFMIEISTDWQSKLQFLDKAFPNHSTEFRDDFFGLGVWTNIKGAKITKSYFQFGNYQLPYIEVDFELNKKKIKAIGMHPLPPISQATLSQRNAMIRYISQKLKSFKGAKMLFGDLNSTPWSRVQMKYLKGFDYFPSRIFSNNTWTPYIFSAIGIPIDFIMYSKEFELLRESEVGPVIGSDHRPIIGHFSL